MDGSDGTRQHRLLLSRLAELVDFQLPEVTGESEGRLTTAPPAGQPADRPDLHPDPDDLIVAVGNGLLALHNLEIAPLLSQDGEGVVSCGWDVVAARCEASVAGGLVKTEQLPEPYARYSAEQLLAMLVEGKPDDADDERHLVLCHGSPTMDRFFVDGGRFSGLDGFDAAVVADRHLDLAVIHQSVQAVLGRDAVFRFYESYGQDPNLPRLEHYVLVSHLLGTARRTDVNAASHQ